MISTAIALIITLTGCNHDEKKCPGGITKPLTGIVRGKALVSSRCFTVTIQNDEDGSVSTVGVSRWTHSHVVIGQRAWLKPEDIG